MSNIIKTNATSVQQQQNYNLPQTVPALKTYGLKDGFLTSIKLSDLGYAHSFVKWLTKSLAKE